jgi:hypothetical protein
MNHRARGAGYPYWNNSSFVGSIDVDTEITISCHLPGDTVTGPYESENGWDMVSGSPDVQVDTGTFVPDAYIYTGSNSPSFLAARRHSGGYSGTSKSPFTADPATTTTWTVT